MTPWAKEQRHFAAKPEGLCSIPRAPMVEGEKHKLFSATSTHTPNKINK